jgi:hypothetical protein
MPTRYLKPGIRDSETIDRLTPMAECLYYRLLVTVDDYGRYDARPSMVKSACYPVKESITSSKCDAMLKELADCGLILLYEVGGKPYMQLQKWDNNPRAKESRFPEPVHTCGQMHTSACNAHTVLPETETETETETERRPRSPSTPDGVPDDVWQAFLKIRRAKRAPMSDIALAGIMREASAAGWTLDAALQECVTRGWQSFKAEWVAKTPPAGQVNPLLAGAI